MIDFFLYTTFLQYKWEKLEKQLNKFSKGISPEYKYLELLPSNGSKGCLAMKYFPDNQYKLFRYGIGKKQRG